ncbi:MAG: SurA N-terminal domain-containing protein [Magnetovibrio sp.]|nr:SurA N-terminal domain-containing protein [Magnetovibrio sp.]
MLKLMRKSVNSIFVKALLVMLIASFAVWGIGDVFKAGRSDTSVAKVGNMPISAASFKSELAREVERVQRTINPNITRDQAIAMGIGDMLLSRMVNSAILNAGAQDMRLMVSKTAILNEIKNSKDFFNDAGVFDSRVFTQLLSNNGLSEDRYVQYLRQGMERDQMLSAITSGAIPPKLLTDALYTYEAEKRVLDVLRINYAQIKNVPKPTDAELSAYHESHTNNFMAPEYRSITALVLNAADLAKTIDLTDEDIQNAYDDSIDDYSKPEKRTLKQILVKDELVASRAAQLLDQGKTFADVAKDVGANPALMNIGTMSRDDVANLSADLATAAFSVSKGQHTAPVKSPLGWHVVVVEGLVKGTVTPLNKVKDTLKTKLQMAKALDALFGLSNQLEDLLGSGMTLEEASQDLGIGLDKAENIDAQGLGLDGKAVTFPFVADILKASLTLQAGDESTMSESEDNQSFFVVRVDAVTPSALRPLDTVKGTVAQAWTVSKRAEMAAELAKTAQTRLQSGEDLNAVAKDMGFASFITLPFTRTGQGLQQGAVPVNVIKSVFTLPQGGVAEAAGTGAHTVARVNTIHAATQGDADPIYKSVTAQTTRALQNDLVQQMTEALQVRFPVRVNQQNLKDVY